jgi:hypothetical protein
VDDLEQDNSLLRTRYFHANVARFGSEPFRAYLYYRDPNGMTLFVSGNSSFNNDKTFQVWIHSKAPPQLAASWKWPLVKKGGWFPEDMVVFYVLFALKVNEEFRDRSVSVEPTEGFQSRWNYTTRFVKLPSAPSQKDLKEIQIDEKAFEVCVRDGCQYFYLVSLEFFRTPVQKVRFNFLWGVGVSLLFLIAICQIFIRRLVDDIFSIGLGIAFFAVPNIIWMWSYLPQAYLQPLEIVYWIDTVWTIFLVILSVTIRIHRHRS